MSVETYIPPVFRAPAFHCPRCGVYSHQDWRALYPTNWNDTLDDLFAARCTHCDGWSYWYEQQLTVPPQTTADPAHPDLPESCRSDFEEARRIVALSPRGSSALLRLVIQKLMLHLGERGKNINDDVAALVGKGLSPIVQQALDVCRVVGNNAVHPGELNLEDSPEIAHQLFRMINFIVQDRISQPKQIKRLYGLLPAASREAIEKRDGPRKGKG